MAAAAATVVLRQARAEQEPVRREMKLMVERAELCLEKQVVFVLEVGLLSADLPEGLPKKSLKIKCRMNNITLLKSRARKAETSDNGRAHIALDTIGKVVYEGGDVLVFDLCESRWFSASCRLASGQISLADIAGGALRNLELYAVEAPYMPLATLALNVQLLASRLEAVGGITALKRLSMPQRPATDEMTSTFNFKQDLEECTQYHDQAIVVQQNLQEAFEEACRLQSRATR
jgi:hypothetical protein